ncbi:hypothetical protein NMY22_g17741 [Coprinellus aureogranulatus]|nr:hypothetical protein NMY22_g17741 [Coprinellus aureogranulatus]
MKDKDEARQRFHFTSEIQEKVSLQAVENKIMDTLVTVSLREIIGISPPLQKRIADTTKTRREYTTKYGEYDLYTPAAEQLLSNMGESHHIEPSQISKPRTIPMSSIRFSSATLTLARLGGVDVICLVDCGSELNVFSERLLERTGLALDFEGSRWSLKGVNGGPVALRGVCKEVPLIVGGHNFDHHFFITREEMDHHDCILGQPWIQWYAARIDYHRSGAMKMLLWKDGDRSVHPTISLSLTKPDDPRNVDTLNPMASRSPSTNQDTHRPATTRSVSCATLGRSVLGLLGDPEFAEFDSLLPLQPPDSYDHLLRKVSHSIPFSHVLKTPWTLRALPEHFPLENRHVLATAKRRYKPVDRKVRPVPTYMPNPIAQQYKPIPEPVLTPLPIHPPPRSLHTPTERMTKERYDQLLATIPDGFLSEQEIDLLAYVVARREEAFAWTFREKGTFKRKYYPDYEIAVIEHTPWVQPPIRVPLSLQAAVRKEIEEQEAAGRFEPTVASYRSSLFAVAKKNGSIRLVIDLQKLNAVTIRDSSLPPNVEDFAEQFVGCAIYGAADLYSGFDARILHPNSRPLTAFHSICGPKQQCTLPQGACNSPQEFQRCTRHALQPEIPKHSDVFIDDCGIKGPETDYGGQAIEGNPSIRRFVFEYATTLDRVLARFIMAGITASGPKTVLATPQLKIVGTVVSLEGWHLDRGLVAVDSAALHGAGWVVYQVVGNERRPAIYGSCTFNETESRYSQPKAELYGLVHSPDLPNAPMTRWIAFLMLFDFEMKHVSAENHKAADGLSRRPRSQHDSDDEDDENILEALTLSTSPRVTTVPDERQSGSRSVLPSSSVKELLSFLLDFRSSSLPSPFPMLRFDVPLSPQGETSSPPPPAYRRPHRDRFIGNNIALSLFEPDDDEDLCLHSSWTAYRIGGVYDSGHETDLFKHTALRFVQSGVYVGHEFEVRHAYTEQTDSFLLGDEVVTLGYRHYVPYAYPSMPLQNGALPPPVFAANAIDLRAFSAPLTADAREDHRLAMTLQAPPARALSEEKEKERIRQDSEWPRLRLFFTSGVVPVEVMRDEKARKRWKSLVSNFFLERGSLWRKPLESKEAAPRLVVEHAERRSQLLVQAHDQCGHRGRDATYKLLSDRYYWPMMYEDVSFYVRSCVQCQLGSQSKPIVPYSASWPAAVLRHFHLDTQFMEKGIRGKRYIISAVDSSSGWIEARALKKADSEAVAKFVYEEVICRFSCIPYFTMDGGSEFKGFVEVLFRQYQVVVVVSNAYHPESNGIVERSHQVLANSLKKVAYPHPARWPLYLPAVLLSMRVTTSRATGLSPFFLVYGVHPVFPFDLQDATWGVLDWHKVQSTTDLIVLRTLQIAQRDQIAQEAHRRLTINRQKSIDNWNDKMRTQSFVKFEVGMWVLRYESRLDNQHGEKDKFKWTGPYIVHEVRPNQSFVLRELDGTVIRGHVTAHRLRLFFYRDEQTLLRTIANAKFYYKYHQAGGRFKSDHPDPVARSYADIDLACTEVDVNATHSCTLCSCRKPDRRWSFEYLFGEVHIPSFTSNLYQVDERFFAYVPYHACTGSIASLPGYYSSEFHDEYNRIEQAAVEDTLAVTPSFVPTRSNRLRYPYGFVLPPPSSP